jgi:hypothetical protein
MYDASTEPGIFFQPIKIEKVILVGVGAGLSVIAALNQV